jgi:hypothetical protein
MAALFVVESRNKECPIANRCCSVQGERIMRLSSRILGIVCTALLLTCLLELLTWGFESFGSPDIVREKGLEQIIAEIERTDVDKRALCSVLRYPIPFPLHFLYQIIWVALVLWLYGKCRPLVDRTFSAVKKDDVSEQGKQPVNKT